MARLSLLEISELPKDLRNLCVNSAVNMAGAGVMTAGYVVYLTTYLQLSATALSMVLSGMPLGLFLGSLVAGRMVDLTNPKWCIIWSNVLFAAAMCALVSLSDARFITIAMFVGGVASSLNYPAKSVYTVAGGHGHIVLSRSVMRSWTYLGSGFGSRTRFATWHIG
ncbi:MFS transporter [Bifidobacterium amazonense]|uniref:MFS transporter n=1 Tax=Bifidobacterium amazonense TaxID=2809027 RepID=A0ABS9VRW0_9BIFI|nr:MFS transporter [Bifidobacterium amazonense]MCH9274830.1 MFS transporter [Bifidobacterium amazonense]